MILAQAATATMEKVIPRWLRIKITLERLQRQGYEAPLNKVLLGCDGIRRTRKTRTTKTGW